MSRKKVDEGTFTGWMLATQPTMKVIINTEAPSNSQTPIKTLLLLLLSLLLSLSLSSALGFKLFFFCHIHIIGLYQIIIQSRNDQRKENPNDL